jgi:hypothetical protein
MNHPTNEEWMSFLYNEVYADEHARLTGHLQDCATCQGRVTEWRAAQKSLDGWQPAPRRAGRKAARPLFARPILKWAAAAVFFAGIGFGAGRLSMLAAVSPQKLRAAIEPEIRRQLHEEFAQTMREELDKSAAATLAASRGMIAAYAEKAENARAEDNHAISTALDRLASQQTDDYVSLKKQLDTVAVLTDAGLRHTENQVAELVDYSQPNQGSNTTKHKAN